MFSWKKLTENNNDKDIIGRFDFYVLLFFMISFIGWLWEVLLYLYMEQRFVNRGILFGPWLPIYGAGGLLMFLLLHKLKKRPFLVFTLSLVICSVLEYLMSWFLEALWGVRWWDYSGYFMNISGRICLLSSIMFGVGGVAILYLLVPLLDKLYLKIPAKARKIICILLLLLFVLDATYAADFPNNGSGISYHP